MLTVDLHHRILPAFFCPDTNEGPVPLVHNDELVVLPIAPHIRRVK